MNTSYDDETLEIGALVIIWCCIISPFHHNYDDETLGMMEIGALVIITPRAHARARGYVIGRGVYILLYIVYCI